MKFRISCLAAVMTIALLAPLADATRGPYIPPVKWDGLDDDFREVVMRAHTVAIVQITKSVVKDSGTMPPSSTATLQFKNPVFLHGKATPKAPTVVDGSRRVAPGTKVIIAWLGKGAKLIPYSKANELATRRALAPGWHVDRGMLCPSCRRSPGTADIGKCGTCAGGTSSGMYKLCGKCAQTANQCQACKRTITQATPDVTLSLNWGRRPRMRMGWLQMTPAKLTVLPGQPAKIEKLKPAIVLPGQSPKLWVGVWGGTGLWYPDGGMYVHNQKSVPAIPELPCINNDLATCSNLFFLVAGPGIDGVEAVGFRSSVIPTRADDNAKPKPLSLEKIPSTFAEFELVVLPGGKAFKTPGTYTVRAVAGRLMSNIHKVKVVAVVGKIPGEIDAKLPPRPGDGLPPFKFRPKQPIFKAE